MANYLKEFENPSARFRGAPFWAWNGKLDRDTLLKQVEYFKEMGLGGFTMHCRTGLDTPYLSEEFLEMVRACVKCAGELGMKAYLYDEDRWPSGFGGGEVTKEDRYRARCLVFTTVRAQDREQEEDLAASASWARGGATRDGKFLASYRVVLENGYLKEYRKLAAAAEAAARERGDTVWYAYLELSPKSPWYHHQSYVNTLDKKAIMRFLETTHEKYYKAVGEEFGGVIPSIFTDEPQFVHKQTFGRAEDQKDVVIPYTDDFEVTYKKAYGESFLEHLPEVFWELPDGAVSLTRYRYHDHLAERFARAYADTLGRWCRKHKIALTGHMMEEPTLHSQTAALGEAMRHYRGFQVPGIDILCDSREYTTAKQAQSAAHQLGKNEVTSELYGVTNWDFDFRGHKQQGDWQAALGVTHRVHHLSWMSMAGEAKRDYPASIFYQSPWYHKYPLIEDYFARVNTALMSGKPKVRIGVIHPVESYWLSFGPDEQTAQARQALERQFRNVTEWLLFGLQDFDYISEGLLAWMDSGRRRGAEPGDPARKPGTGTRFKAGSMDYDVVIIPGCRTLRSGTVERLRDFVSGGGTLIIMGGRPTLIDAVPADYPEEFAAARQIAFDEGELIRELESVRLVDMRNGRGVRTDSYLYQMRDLGRNRIVFLANARKDANPDVPERRTWTITLKGSYEVEELDAMSGKRLPLASGHCGGDTVITKELYQHDSLLLYLKPCTAGEEDAAESQDGMSGTSAQKGVHVSEQKGKRAFGDEDSGTDKTDKRLRFVRRLNILSGYETSEPNVLMLDQAEFALDDEEFAPAEEVLRIDNILRERLGWPRKMDAFAQPWTEEDEPAEHTVSLRYQFESAKAFEDIRLACEYLNAGSAGANDMAFRIVLNNRIVPAVSDGYYTDECIRTVRLPKLKKGMNELVLTLPYRKRSNLEWSYLLGEFGVRVSGNRARLVKKPGVPGFGDLGAQGFPFYGGNFTYLCEIEVPKGCYVLEIPKYRAPLVTVSVDGTEEQAAAFAPYRAELGELEGKHMLRITAYGSRVNTFGTVHLCDETVTWSGPNAWRTQGYQFSYEYQLKRTGILAGPVLYRREGLSRNAERERG